MHPYFPEVYRAVTVIPTEEQMQRRLAALKEYQDQVGGEAVLELARLLYILPTRGPEFQANFARYFQRHDSAFTVAGNDFELQILAGCALVELLTGKQSLANAAALAIVAAEFRGRRSGERPSQFLGQAREYLMRASVERTKFAREFRLPKTVAAIEPASDNAVFTKALNEQASRNQSLLTDWERILNLRQTGLEEEVNIMWWVLGAHSRDLEMPISKVSSAAAPLIAGKELADLAEIMPGPVSGPAILDRFLSNCAPSQTISPFQALRSAPREWLSKWVREKATLEQCGGLCAVLFATQRFLEAPSSAAWAKTAQSATNVDFRSPLPPLELAIQVYDECRLVRAYKDAMNVEAGQ